MTDAKNVMEGLSFGVMIMNNLDIRKTVEELLKRGDSPNYKGTPDYITKLEALVRQVPELVEAIADTEHYIQWNADELYSPGDNAKARRFKEVVDNLNSGLANLQRVLGEVEK